MTQKPTWRSGGWTLAVAGLAACGGPAETNQPQTLMNFEASFDAASGKMTITPMESMSGITIPVNRDSILNSAPAGTVELQTLSESQDTGVCGGSLRYCATVRMRSFFGTDILNGPTAEILTISPATGHMPLNGLVALRPIDIAHGANLTPGLFDYPNINPNGQADRQWIFENLTGQNFRATGRVYADPIPAQNGDYSVSATMLFVDNDWGGIMGRISNNGNSGYRFRIGLDVTNGRGCRLERLDNGVVTHLTGRTLGSSNCVFARSTDGIFRLQMDGNVIRAFLNGNEIMSAVDSTYSGGAVALYTWGNGDPPHPPFNNGIRFDNVSVNRLADNAVLFSDNFQRADGPVGNGWTVNDQCSIATAGPPAGCQQGAGVPVASNWRIVNGRAIDDTNIFSLPIPANLTNTAVPEFGIGFGTLLLSPNF